jgi:glycosyltransferase involved in cell wall biosynthesis
MIWITWEIQRRNEELVKSFGKMKLFEFNINASRFKRYLILIVKTLNIIWQERPAVVCVQNPSIVLTVLVLILRRIGNYRVVVDRHTKTNMLNDFMTTIEDIFEKYALRKADLTIVTNNELLQRLTVARGAVLPDKIPDLPLMMPQKLAGYKNVVFICTYAIDEPVEEVIKAADMIDPNIFIYITGRIISVKNELLSNTPSNVVFTDFLPEEEYIRLLCSADVLLDLTTLDSCLVCGAYEAVSLAKPLVTSNTSALRAYFNKGTVYTENKAEDIAEKIQFALENANELIAGMKALKKETGTSWEKQKDAILLTIESLS